MTASPEHVARLEGVVVRRPGRGPIGPLDLTVGAGEIIALVGASGCGKSTALRLLAGLEAPHEGRAERRVKRGRIGLVFQNPTLLPWASALENAGLPLRLEGRPREEARSRARTALEQVGLGDRLKARPHQLSGGMAMRASLARALVTGPELLLLDEPFAALDSITRRGLIEDIHRLWTRDRPAIVFVTHDVDEAAYLARRILVMNAATGRFETELAAPGPVPRPPARRADPEHARVVEGVAAALETAMIPAGAAA